MTTLRAMPLFFVAGAYACFSADTSLLRAEPLAGFKLDGDRWTYQDDTITIRGILLKPEGKGPFPAVLISHGLGGSAQSFGLGKAREMVKWGLVCIAPDYAHAGGMGQKLNPQGPERTKYGASEENLRRA